MSLLFKVKIKPNLITAARRRSPAGHSVQGGFSCEVASEHGALLNIMSKPATQQQFLRDAKDKLGMTWKEFATRIGAPEPTLKKWSLITDSESNGREMPSTVWVLVREVLAHEALKKKVSRFSEKA